jgi:hypothetical protein
MKKTREQKRNESAEKVCRELRYQFAEHGRACDTETLFKHFEEWLKVAKDNQWERP